MIRKIAMTTIRTVLTMLNSGFSYSKIRHHTGASNGFINKLASVARPDLEAFLKLSDEEICERVYPKTGVSGLLCLGRLFQGQPNEAALSFL